VLPVLLLASAILLAPEQPVAPATYGATPYNAGPAIAPTNNGFLAVWRQRSPLLGPRDSGQLWAMPFGFDGEPLRDQPVPIASTNSFPSIASSGADALVVWSGGSRRLAIDGTPLEPASPTAASRVVWDGTRYVTFSNAIDAAAVQGHTLALTLSGGVLSANGATIATGVTTAGVAAGSDHFLVLWKAGGVQYATTVALDGAVGPTAAAGPAANDAQPSAAWDGSAFHVEWDGAVTAANGTHVAVVRADNGIITTQSGAVLSRLRQLQSTPKLAGDAVVFGVSPIGTTGGIRIARDGVVTSVTDDATRFEVSGQTIAWISSDGRIHGPSLDAPADDVPIAVDGDLIVWRRGTAIMSNRGPLATTGSNLAGAIFASNGQVVWQEGTTIRTPDRVITDLGFADRLVAFAGNLAVYTHNDELRAFRLDAPADDVRIGNASTSVTILGHQILWSAPEGIYRTVVDDTLATPITTLLVPLGYATQPSFAPGLTAVAYTNLEGRAVVRTISTLPRRRAM
jgi:hypothetical protein